jgi:hypothetical protein
MDPHLGPSPDRQPRHTDLIAVTVLLLLLSGVSAVSEGLRLGREAVRPHLTEIGDELRRERDTWRKESHEWRDEARQLRREAERIQSEIERELRSNRDLPMRIRTNRL